MLSSTRRFVAGHAPRALLAAVAFTIAPHSVSAQTPAAAPPTTLWRFLGIPQGVHTVHDTLVNRCGRLPGLERKPPLLRIADPSLAAIDNAAIKKAQKIKAEEDLAPQKIKAIKYLATLGCEKCYGGIDEAMLESLKDCTESVRYETVKALGEIPDQKCPHCDNDCCNEKITEQLAKMAYERDEVHPDCWYEPSARIRNAAKNTLQVCCCDQQPPADATTPAQQSDSPPPEEGGPTAPPVEGGPTAAVKALRESSNAIRLTQRQVVVTNNVDECYDEAMAVHIAPRRSRVEGAAPDPNEERSVVVASFVEDRTQAMDSNTPPETSPEPTEIVTTFDAPATTAEPSATEYTEVEVSAPQYAEVAPARRTSRPPRSVAARPTTSMQASRTPHRATPTNTTAARTNLYGRRYVSWGTPQGEYAPVRQADARPVVRRGVIDYSPLPAQLRHPAQD